MMAGATDRHQPMQAGAPRDGSRTPISSATCLRSREDAGLADLFAELDHAEISRVEQLAGWGS